MATAVAARSEVPKEQQWNAESVFAAPQDWDEAFAALESELPQVDTFRGHLDNAGTLADWLEFDANLDRQLGKLFVYAGMAYSVDTTDAAAVERMDRVRGLASRLAARTAFAQPEILAQGHETLQGWLAEEPRLATYRHSFERLQRTAGHTRSAEVETLLGALRRPFSTATSVHGVLANTDMRFPAARQADGEEAEISQGNIRKLLASPDRSLRQSAWENYADAHLALQNTMAQALSAGIQQNVFLAETRGYASALEAALQPEGIPLGVFSTLLDTFQANLPTWHRYWRARRQALGVRQLHPYDVFAPLTSNAPEVSYEQAVTWLGEALAPLGPDYVETLRRGALQERWVDRSVNRGKRMGAFSSGVQGTHPFIMMSYTGDVFSMSTLAHELGHSLHSYLAWHNQPHVYSDYSLFVAEVASNFHQAMLRSWLFEQMQDHDFQIALIEEAMANFYRYFFVMPTLARFELEIHQRTARGQALSASTLVSLMADLLAEGYGGELNFDRERVGITWAQFHTHLYSRFYVYQYATGISGAHALAGSILAGEEGAAQRYLSFLKAGGSKYPLDALKDAGVDLTGPEPVEETFAVLSGLVDRLEALTGQGNPNAVRRDNKPGPAG
ncbi:MAG TPA: oligoendopeptidase F [Trueperaceae bacterium]